MVEVFFFDDIKPLTWNTMHERQASVRLMLRSIKKGHSSTAETMPAFALSTNMPQTAQSTIRAHEFYSRHPNGTCLPVRRNARVRPTIVTLQPRKFEKELHLVLSSANPK